MKKLSILLVLLVSVSFGCSTVKGLGEDIAGLGKGIAKMAGHVQENVGKKAEE